MCPKCCGTQLCLPHKDRDKPAAPDRSHSRLDTHHDALPSAFCSQCHEDLVGPDQSPLTEPAPEVKLLCIEPLSSQLWEFMELPFVFSTAAPSPERRPSSCKEEGRANGTCAENLRAFLSFGTPAQFRAFDCPLLAIRTSVPFPWRPSESSS